jgi:hypothetical protein
MAAAVTAVEAVTLLRELATVVRGLEAAAIPGVAIPGAHHPIPAETPRLLAAQAMSAPGAMEEQAEADLEIRAVAIPEAAGLAAAPQTSPVPLKASREMRRPAAAGLAMLALAVQGASGIRAEAPQAEATPAGLAREPQTNQEPLKVSRAMQQPAVPRAVLADSARRRPPDRVASAISAAAACPLATSVIPAASAA